MKNYRLFVTVASFALVSPALAETAAAPSSDAAATETGAAGSEGATKEIFSTGVAKGRDRLDSATSTSTLRFEEVEKLAPRSVADILRDIPGVRSEASVGEGGASISIRGLPIASSGTKFVQLQEDGLPVVEFGDIVPIAADSFIRADLNLVQVEAIRGGSASTFASNSPGGIINFLSKNGDVEGGSIEATAGLDFGLRRVDFDYGAPVSDTLRFHVGGFYRDGEGPRKTGYDAMKGGQFKFNVTKDLGNGYIRLYGKYLDDRTPVYDAVPMQVTGTDSDPTYRNIPGFDVNNDTLQSRYLTTNVLLDGNNNLVRHDIRDGQHVKAKSIGLEAQFDVADWTITDRFRYANQSNHLIFPIAPVILPASALPAALGAPGGTAVYANGPNAGQVITDAANINGNGLLAWQSLFDVNLKGLDNITNDLRANRVWNVGGGDLTVTGGVYASRQQLQADWLYTSPVTDVRGDGRLALVNIIRADGVPITQDGFYGYNFALTGGLVRRSFDVDYTTTAPFASVNYHIGRLAIGASARYDIGNANGSIYGVDLGNGRVGNISYDINNDGVISDAETRVAVTPLGTPAPVDYNYHYLSYSVSANYRVSDPFAVFARYSRGARANADRILFTPIVSTVTGKVVQKGLDVDFVKQAELGLKFRKRNLTLNVTGFWARTEDTNLDNATGLPLSREYGAKGVEFEGAYQMGPFSINAGATYTKAEIKKDNVNPAAVGNTPRHQADLIFQVTPQFSTEHFTVGAIFIGTTDSYAQDTDQLKMPGYVTTNAFVQFRPVKQLQLSLNANNLFDVKALTAVDNPTLPANGLATVRPLNGRTVSASVRFDF